MTAVLAFLSTLFAWSPAASASPGVIPLICEMAPPVNLSHTPAGYIPSMEVSVHAAIKHISVCTPPLMSIQWRGTAYKNIDHIDALKMQSYTSFNSSFAELPSASGHKMVKLAQYNCFVSKIAESAHSLIKLACCLHAPTLRLHAPILRVKALAQFAREKVKQSSVWLPGWLLDTLIWAHMLIMSAICLPLVYALVYAPFVLLAAGGFSVIIDVAKAVAGLSILIVGVAPHRLSSHMMIMRIISFFDRILLRCMVRVLYMLNSRTLKLLLTCFWLFPSFPSVQATGRETPKIHFMEYFLPGVTRWDAIPYHDFRRVWWVALCAALGNISQEGWSLLQTARDQDLGSPGNPGTPAQTVQSNNRNHRVFGAILNYIEATSWLYHYVSTTFANNGRGLFQYLYVYGHLPYTSEERVTLENEWKDATISSVGIKYSPNAVFKWAEYLSTLADKLGKSERDKRVKYLQGFPSSFDVLIVAERARGAIGTYTHPATYPAHHPQAGVAHPQGGQPDIYAMASGFYSEWARMCNNGQIKSIPKGFAHAQRLTSSDMAYIAQSSDESDNDEHACMARDRISRRTICGICGGIGHAGKVDGTGTCLTAKLGHRIPSQDLSRIQYPDGYNPPRFLHSNQGSSSRQSPHSSTKYLNRPHPSKARMIEETAENNATSATALSTPPPSLEEDVDWLAAVEAEAEAKRLQQAYARAYNKRTPQPRQRRTTMRPKSRARQAHDNPPSKETPQTSARDAHDSPHESDEDEHGRLAVEISDVTFNV